VCLYLFLSQSNQDNSKIHFSFRCLVIQVAQLFHFLFFLQVCNYYANHSSYSILNSNFLRDLSLSFAISLSQIFREIFVRKNLKEVQLVKYKFEFSISFLSAVYLVKLLVTVKYKRSAGLIALYIRFSIMFVNIQFI